MHEHTFINEISFIYLIYYYCVVQVGFLRGRVANFVTGFLLQ